MIRVLITGAGALLGQGIIKATKKSKLPVEIIAADPNMLSAGLYWADRYYLVPMANDSQYKTEVEKIIAKEKPQFLLIGTDVELPFFASHKKELEQEYHCRIIVSSEEVVGIADDKYRTYLFLKDNGFLYPKTCLPEEKDLFLKEADYPLIVKPRIGARSADVYRVYNKQELNYRLSQISNPLIQEYIGLDEEEFTAGTLVFDRKCEASVVMKRDLRDGNTYRAFIDHYEQYNSEIVKVAEALNPFGPANFQFRVDKKGIKIFEINARFSGTTPIRAMAGFNEVDMLLNRLINGLPIMQPKIKPMTVLRYWEEMIAPDYW